MNQARPTRAQIRRPQAGRHDVYEDHLRKLTETLRANLEKCANAPDIDPVHDVRTGTRRLQAIIEAILRGRDDDSLQQTASKWLDVLKKIRRAAAPVRDLDVHRSLLRKLVRHENKVEDAGRASASADSTIFGTEPHVAEAPVVKLPGNRLADDADHLDAWLHHARQHRAAALKKKAAKFLAKFDDETAAFIAAIRQSPRKRRRARSAVVVALESFVRLVHEMQQLDEGNLHDFRKGAKKARYIAESAAEDAHAIAVGKTLKKLQDDIGDWHDRLVLADEARTALGDQCVELVNLLDAERDHYYKLSIRTVNRLRGKLMGEWLAVSQPSRRPSTRTLAASYSQQKQMAS